VPPSRAASPPPASATRSPLRRSLSPTCDANGHAASSLCRRAEEVEPCWRRLSARQELDSTTSSIPPAAPFAAAGGAWLATPEEFRRPQLDQPGPHRRDRSLSRPTLCHWHVLRRPRGGPTMGRGGAGNGAKVVGSPRHHPSLLRQPRAPWFLKR
jgi:hypothetical protein